MCIRDSVPESFSRFVAAFGVGAALDPYLLFVVDFVANNYGCSEQCSDYTSPSCRCHEGDAWKLYVRLDAEEGAGITGALLTIMVCAGYLREKQLRGNNTDVEGAITRALLPRTLFLVFKPVMRFFLCSSLP